jgi:hypothetical protein
MKLTKQDCLKTIHLSANDAAKELQVGSATVARARLFFEVKPKRGAPKTKIVVISKCPCGNDAEKIYCSLSCYHQYKVVVCSEERKEKISAKAKARWQTPSDNMLRGIQKRVKSDLTEYKSYRNRLKVLTEHTYLMYTSKINPENHPRRLAGTEGGYHLDHIIPARYGFENSIPPEVLADKDNLQMLTWRDNISKGCKHEG